MSSKVKLIQGLCVSLVMLLMANAVGAAEYIPSGEGMSPDVLQRNAIADAEIVVRDAPLFLTEYPLLDHKYFRLAERAAQAVLNDPERGLDRDRALRNFRTAKLAKELLNMCAAIFQRERGEMAHADIGHLKNSRDDVVKDLNQILLNR